MHIIAIVSMKGGVGKTTTVANLAAALQNDGRQVLAVDLDPQNALRLHMGDDLRDPYGLAAAAMEGGSLAGAARRAGFGTLYVPYGLVDEPTRIGFESLLAAQPDWLARQLRGLDLPAGSCVLLDTPPGPSVYLQQALTAASMVLAVNLADAASYATLAASARILGRYGSSAPGGRADYYIFNQYNPASAIARDVLAVAREDLGERFVPVVLHRDETAAEALACQQPVLNYDQHAQTSSDFKRLAAWLGQRLE